MQDETNKTEEQLHIPSDIKTKILNIASNDDISMLSDFIKLFKQKRLELSLMSENSLQDIWSRHILDSIQLNSFIKDIMANNNYQTRSAVIDLGSGNGFPIIPIILTLKQKDVDYFLIEKSKKKAQYLNGICNEILSKKVLQDKLNIDIICDDFENIKNLNKQFNIINRPNIIITARAFKSISTILDIISGHKILESNITIILLKGASTEIEITDAKKKYLFDIKTYKSLTEEGFVLVIRNIHKLNK